METPASFNFVQVLFYFALGFFTCWGVIAFILRWIEKKGQGIRGRDFHHTHKTPVSRLGGVGLVAAFSVVVLAIYFFSPLSDGGTYTLAAIVFCCLAIFTLGFWDDLKPLGAKFKLLGQISIAAVAYDANIRIEIFRNPLTDVDFNLGIFGFLGTVFWLVSLTNLINLIDGIDGLAGGICLMLMFLLANLGMGDSLGLSMLLSIGAAGALCAFLKFNYPPAKIYMGDGGAYLLGFLIGVLSIVSSNKGTVAAALIAPAFALALPIVDVSLAVLRRVLRGLPIFRPDRRHIHHHLITLGISHERTVLNLYTVSLLCLILAFSVFYVQGRMLPLYAGFLFLVLLIAGHLSGLTKNWFRVGSQLGKALALRKETQYALALSRWLMLEVERNVPEQELWQDYKLFVRKLGFSKLKLALPDGSVNTWQSDGWDEKANDLLHIVHDMSDGTVIEFQTNRAVMSEGQFDLLGDLAAETWYKISAKWKLVNSEPFRLHATGANPENRLPKEAAPKNETQTLKTKTTSLEKADGLNGLESELARF